MLFFVKPTSQEARETLVDFLEEKGLTYIREKSRDSMLTSHIPVAIYTLSKTMYRLSTVTTEAVATSQALLVSENKLYEEYKKYDQ